jgi:putative endonuclease
MQEDQPRRHTGQTSGDAAFDLRKMQRHPSSGPGTRVTSTWRHKSKAVAGFTKPYAVDKLVWFEIYDDPTTTIAREKELKKWRRAWKIRLIEERSPQWIDLYPQIST